MSSPLLGPQSRVLVITEDDDLGEPLLDLLRRAGYGVELADRGEGAGRLSSGDEGSAAAGGGGPDALVLDCDLPPDHYQTILDLLAPRAGPASFPLLLIGGGRAPRVPPGWHEDAYASVSRPPQPGEILATLASLRRLVFYRRYRDLVHDLAQPVMTIHALSQGVAKLEVKDETARLAIERLAHEAERLMSLMERFQRGRSAR